MQRIWNLLCSLKLAIVLASLATLSIMLGSLWMPGNMQLFGLLDTMPLGSWFSGPGAEQVGLSWWVYFASACIVAFGINTLCCFSDWLLHIKARWRKSGEYLLHLGFCLVLVAYIWGAFDGARALEMELAIGDTRALPERPGFYLRLDDFNPQIDPSGRPLDFRQQLSLYRGDTLLTTQQVRLNHPLTWHDIVIIPSSYRPEVNGFRFVTSQQETLTWKSNSHLQLGKGLELQTLDFYPHVTRLPNGRVIPRGQQLGNPAFLLQLVEQGQPVWRGWYLLREELPERLQAAGLRVRPLSPLTTPLSLLNVNLDPGAPLAAAGGILMAIGICLALLSYYGKRRRGEHPEVA
ncbi:MAG: hypothetical protein C0624_12750 [Desulfuromonas sp.]|nr:MAG: hypothetical protein C0624_12750 [Desulfuromonas sp.]